MHESTRVRCKGNPFNRSVGGASSRTVTAAMSFDRLPFSVCVENFRNSVVVSPTPVFPLGDLFGPDVAEHSRATRRLDSVGVGRGYRWRSVPSRRSPALPAA